MVNKFLVHIGLVLASASSLPLNAADSAFGLTPSFAGFVDPALAPAEMSVRRSAVISYMTAEEMKAQVAALTGYEHPAFDEFANVLGTFDPATGQRTIDKPTLLSVLFMNQIAVSVASYVVERETFLDDNERIVFTRVDLNKSPTDTVLDSFLDALHTRWLGTPVGPISLGRLHGQFRTAEAQHGIPAGYRAVLEVLLQHGGLFYY